MRGVTADRLDPLWVSVDAGAGVVRGDSCPYWQMFCVNERLSGDIAELSERLGSVETHLEYLGGAPCRSGYRTVAGRLNHEIGIDNGSNAY